MFPKMHKILLFLLAGSFALTACGGVTNPSAAQATATPVPVALADQGVVVDGRLVPRETVELAFDSGGEVAEVLVEKGDLVQAGDVIARLSGREPLESNLANANLELASAQQELINAQQALQQLDKDLPDAQTAALQSLTDARDALRDAERRVSGLSVPTSQPDIDEAYANMILAKDRLDKARKDYKPYEKKAEDNIIRAGLLNRLATAQRNYDAAVRKYNNLTGTTNAFDMDQAQAELRIAQERLDQAQKHHDMLQSGPDPDEVKLAESRILTAKSRIEAAQTAITAAEAALKGLDLVATIDGTVVNLDLISGQRVTPGTPVLRLADFSQWFVETDNLTEIEVVNVSSNDQATVVPDAIPELSMSGLVDSISDLYEEKRGDVTYTARLKLDGTDPRLRWGMTVAVKFQK
jgi:multidrug resistance efflux pump